MAVGTKHLAFAYFCHDFCLAVCEPFAVSNVEFFVFPRVVKLKGAVIFQPALFTAKSLFIFVQPLQSFLALLFFKLVVAGFAVVTTISFASSCEFFEGLYDPTTFTFSHALTE